MGRIAVIFGGCGFIGSHLARQLKESGAFDRIVCADISDEARFATEGVDYMTCDVRQEIPTDLAPGVTDIFNLAAVHATPGHEDWEYFWTNVLGASHICDYARRTGVSRMVFTSSIAVYGPCDGPTRETAALRPNGAYGRSKFCAETIHHQWRREEPAQRRLIVARPAIVFGFSERGNISRLARLLKRGAFIFPGRKDTIKSCGYVKDLTRSFLYFLDQPIDTITYNFAYTERTTTADLCASFQRVAGYPPATRVMPLWFMMIVGLGFEVLQKLGMRTSISRARMAKLVRPTDIVPDRLDRSGYVRRFTLDEAVADWYRDSGDLTFT